MQGRLGRLVTLIVLATVVTSALPLGSAGGDAGSPPPLDAAEFPACAVSLDVFFLFDTTGSMGGVLASAKAGASQIMSNVNFAAPGTRFGVANYRDYNGFYSYPGYATTYGSFGDFPWQLNAGLTTSTVAVGNAINALSIGNGADTPESLTRGLYESQFVAWNPNAVKLVVLFADAPPHDLDFGGNNFGSDPGRDAIAQTSDDLDFETVVAQHVARGIHLVTVDSGGGFAAPYFQYMAAQTDGGYELLGGNFVQQVTNLILRYVPKPYVAGQATALRVEPAEPANPRVDVVPLNLSSTTSGSRYGALAHVSLPPALNGHVNAASDGVVGTRSPGVAFARANATVANFSLLGGLVRGSELRSTVESRTTATGAASTNVESYIGKLYVNGVPIDTAVPPNTMIPVPGVGVLILHEQKVATNPGKSSEIIVNAIHLVVDNAQLRGDVVVASAYAGTTCGVPLGAVLATFDNDAGTGGDAGNTPQTATPISSPTAFQGRLVGTDTVDYYRIPAAIGTKVEALLVPSTRALVSANPLPGSPPSAVAELTNFNLVLHEPGTFAVRETSRLPATAPDRVELNVDVAGDWVLEVVREGGPGGNYTFAAAVTPIALLAQNDALSGGDAPNACGAALGVAQGAHVGVLRDADYRDFYKTRANIGDLLAVTVKPTEDADGADFDLFLYDNACNLLSMSELGKDVLFEGAVPKGVPDAVTLLPVLVSQDYRIEVRRVNGIGNYYLTVAVQDPQPTLAPIGVEGGGDAGSSAATAKPIATPGLYQGAFPDGDKEDWYRFTATTGQRIVVTITGSAVSDFDLHLVRPNGSTAASTTLASNVPEAIVFAADATGPWNLRVVDKLGGGDYTFTVALAPP